MQAVGIWKRFAVVGVTAALVLVACGDDDDKESSTPATTVAPTSTTLSQAQLDKQKATRIVLTAADVPGFTMDAPDASDDDPALEQELNACVNNNALITRLDTPNDPRGASSPDYSKDDETTVGSSVTFGETEDEARTAITELSAATFPACFTKAVTAAVKRDATFTNPTVSTAKLPTLKVGDQSVGYRGTVKARANGTAVTFYLDVTFVRVGRAFASLDGSTVGKILPEAERLRLVTALAGRMAAP